MAMSHRCPTCHERMHLLSLPGLQGRPLQADHCRACRLVWFDVLEPSALAQSAWIALLTEMARSARDEPPPLDEAPARCPRCDAPLVVAPQVGVFGRSVGLACPDGHGIAQRDGALLASRGLFRALTLGERVWLSTERRQLSCLPCGAPLTGEADHCTHCGSPATVFDLPRVSEALGLHGAADGGDAPVDTWPCPGCGAPLDVAQQVTCPQCQRPVLAHSAKELLPLLERAEANRRGRTREATARLMEAGPRIGHWSAYRLSGREEHRAALDELEVRFWQRWRWMVGAAAALGLLAWCSSR
jgi:Zn-finger nucleic acid-binding protein